jgi:hypothetical protein
VAWLTWFFRVIQTQSGHLTYPQATANHQSKHSSVMLIEYGSEQLNDVVIRHIPWQMRSGLEPVPPTDDRIGPVTPRFFTGQVCHHSDDNVLVSGTFTGEY